MKVLYITPTRVGERSFGAAKRSNDLRDALMLSHDVDTLLVHGGPVIHLDDAWADERVKEIRLTRFGAGFTAWGQRRTATKWTSEIIETGDYDFVVARYVGMASLVASVHRAKLIIDGDDLSKTQNGSIRKRFTTRLLANIRDRMARRVANGARHVWIVNPNDAYRLARAETSLLPNSVLIRPPGQLDKIKANRLLMVGLFEYGPNVDGLNWFARHVLPTLVAERPGLEFHAIGRHSADFSPPHPAVRLRGYVDDIVGEYAESALVIAPITSGGGTQIKVLEALSFGRPLIASLFAYQGFSAHLKAPAHLCIASDPDEWIKACRWVLNHQSDASLMAAKGRAVVNEFYSTERFNSLVSETLEALRHQSP